MANFNRVFHMGNLTRDPELRYTPQGMAVVNLRLAINRRYKDKAGQQRDEVCYITAVVWNRQAETCNQYLRKGRPVFVEGRLQSRSYEDNTGQKRNVIEVRAERVQFLGSPSSASREAGEEAKDAMASIDATTTEHDWLEERKDILDETEA